MMAFKLIRYVAWIMPIISWTRWLWLFGPRRSSLYRWRPFSFILSTKSWCSLCKTAECVLFSAKMTISYSLWILCISLAAITFSSETQAISQGGLGPEYFSLTAKISATIFHALFITSGECHPIWYLFRVWFTLFCLILVQFSVLAFQFIYFCQLKVLTFRFPFFWFYLRKSFYRFNPRWW